MRLIVSCGDCKRQYDASGKKPGARFRCHCGGEVIVQQPKGKDASVIRCSSCGAPREGNAGECAHCGADFTIHDQDLQTVCPSCLARVSDRARYCHHCATLLVAESVAGESTSCDCPACGSGYELTHRQLSNRQINVLECQVCGGFWIALETFEKLLDLVSQQSKPSGKVGTPPPSPPSQERSAYRPCAVCGQLMNRRNFGRNSGVVVDICGSHGIWFDAQELAQVVRWVRSGGLEAAQLDMARLRRSTDSVRKRQAFRNDQPAASSASEKIPPYLPLDTPANTGNDPFEEIAEAAIALVGRMFLRRW
jgi:Zn-finger nucleic acid-binding protein